MLNPTPRERMLDPQGRPYFLWDEDLTLEEFERRLEHQDPKVHAYFVGKLMRQAKPDDVFEFISARAIRDQWEAIQPYLGRKREFWTWLFGEWEQRGFDTPREILANKLCTLLKAELVDRLVSASEPSRDS